MTELNIEVISDPVCPWCYIGKRRLDRALAERPEIVANIRWSPYQLSPDMPREGRDRQEHYAQIFGEERARVIRESMVDTARGEGLSFQTKPGARSPNTLSAHLLMYWAEQAGTVDLSMLAEKIFAAHHCASEDLGDPEVLARLASEVGLDTDQVRRDLDTGKDEATVRDQISQAAGRGVSGVPFFVFNERYAVSGAQPTEAFVELLDRLVQIS